MPKKFVGENSKAVAARARKAAVKEAETIKKAQEAEDKAWEDNDKQVLKKKQKQVRVLELSIKQTLRMFDRYMYMYSTYVNIHTLNKYVHVKVVFITFCFD